MKNRPHVCPVCGGEPRESTEVPFLVCARCQECLLPSECVRRASKRTRIRYALANGHDSGYGARVEVRR